MERAHLRGLLGREATNGLSHEQQYDRLAKRLTQLASDPAAMSEVVGAMSAPFASASPELGDIYQSQLVAALGYLYQSLPKNPATPPLFGPETWEPSPEERLSFRDRAEVVANPMAAVRHMAAGTLSPDHVDAIANVYPRIYDEMRGEVLRFAAEHPDANLPIAERASVSAFLGQATDPMTDPGMTATLQSAYAPMPGTQQHGGGNGARPAPSRMGDLPSPASAFASTMGPSPKA